jgi:DNA topoisomerase-3
VYQALRKQPEPKEEALRRADMAEDVFDNALEKLWIHGGADVDPDDSVRRGAAADWKKSYVAQKKHRLAELEQIFRFTQAHGCRMLHLVRHFGDQEDSGEPCGLCDVCAPGQSIAHRFREPSQAEQAALGRILAALAGEDGQATGRLHRETFADGSVDRRTFEHLLGALARGGLVEVRDASFQKDGERIEFQRASLTDEGWAQAEGKGAARVTLGEVASPKKRKKQPKGKPQNGAAEAPSGKKQAARRAFFARIHGKRRKG